MVLGHDPVLVYELQVERVPTARLEVLATHEYEIAANWKLVMENNRECYHCDVNHPQYVKANYDNAAGDQDTTRRRQALAAEVTSGDGIRAAASYRGCDLWPVLRASGWSGPIVEHVLLHGEIRLRGHEVRVHRRHVRREADAKLGVHG